MYKNIHLKTFIIALSLAFSTNLLAHNFKIHDKLESPDVYFNKEAAYFLDAILKEDESKIKLAQLSGNVDVNAKGPQTSNPNPSQITMLSYALGINNQKASAKLMALGSDPLFRTDLRHDNSFIFLIARENIEMLDFLYKKWPITKIPLEDQQFQAFSALSMKCQQCLQTMFNHGIDVNIKDENGANLFMEALKVEQWDLAWWLLQNQKVSINAESKSGVTPVNLVQLNLYKYQDNRELQEKITSMKNYMEKVYNVKFPVPTSLQIRAKKSS